MTLDNQAQKVLDRSYKTFTQMGEHVPNTEYEKYIASRKMHMAQQKRKVSINYNGY